MELSNKVLRVIAELKDLVNLSAHIDTEQATINIRNGIAFRGPNVFILFFAILIASLGLNVNSIPVIIGAMLISPLMGPIIGFGLALGTNDLNMLGSALRNFAVMVIISILASTLYFILTPLEMENPTELLTRTNPTIYDVLIAFFGGLAGIVEISRKEKGTVISGVAIATALMPPLCTVGYGISIMNWHYAVGAFYLFIINSVFIALATSVSAVFLGYKTKREGDERQVRRRRWIMGLILLVMIVPSIISAIGLVKTNNFNRSVSHFISDNKTLGKSYIYDYKVNLNEDPHTIDLYMAGEQLTAENREKLYTNAEESGFVRSQLIFHEDAVTNFTPFNQEAVIKDIFANNERMLKERDEKIESLEMQLEQYKHNELPTSQLTREVQTQYPIISGLTLATGEQQLNDSTLQPVMVVLLQYSDKKHLKEAELNHLTEWLKVRLENKNIIVQ